MYLFPVFIIFYSFICACVSFVTKSTGGTFSAFNIRSGYNRRHQDYKNFAVEREIGDEFPLIIDSTPQQSNVYAISFEFGMNLAAIMKESLILFCRLEVPLDTPLTLPDVPRKPYYSEKIGRAHGIRN